MSRFILPFQSVFDKNGKPLDGAKLFFYETGTNTLKDTYSDQGFTTANTNPLIADSQGEFGSIFLSGTYRVELKDKNDVTQPNYPADSVPGETGDTTLNIVSLRLIEGRSNQRMFLLGYYAAGDNGGGQFYWDALSTVADNGGTVIKATDIPTGRWIRLYLKSLNIEWFGAKADSTTDDAPFILEALNVIRADNGGTLNFPARATILLSYGFRLPNYCTINLHGCTLKATTTVGQGTIPTNGYSSGFFAGSQINAASPISASSGNMVIIGDGASFDCRRDEQTGTPTGFMGLVFETTDTPVVADQFRLKNIIASDITIERSGWDGTYISGAENVLFKNIKCQYSLRIGHTLVDGKNIVYDRCSATYTIGANTNEPVASRGPSNSGDGFWSEPNNTWQELTNVRFVKCDAQYNYQSGFKPYNAGADVPFNIELDQCYSFSNVYDYTVPAIRSSPGFSQYEIRLNDTGNATGTLRIKGCIADTSNGSGIIINKGNGAGDNIRIIVSDLTLINCNINNSNSISRAPINVEVETGTALVIITNPVIIAPDANTLGYGIYVGSPTNTHIINPTYVGAFTFKTLLAGTPPAVSARETYTIDPASDDKVGLTGIGMPYWKPVRPASFDQTSEPTISTDMFKGEIAVWQDDNEQFTGIYKRDDSDTPTYIDFNKKKRGRGRADLTGSSNNIAANTSEKGTITVTGATLGDIVGISTTALMDTDLILTAQVTSSNTVTYRITNPTLSTKTRATTYVTVSTMGSDY